MANKIPAVIILLFCIASCDLIDYHPYDARVRTDTGINNTNIVRIEEECYGKETIRFIMMGDSQRWYDETVDFVEHVNARSDIDFVIHGGDLADFGLTLEFKWMHEIMDKLRVPYVAVIGNHDILGNGAEVYKEMYGELNFSFTAGRNKFICMNTNALEFDYSQLVPDFDFIRSELESDSEYYLRTIPVMHAKPGSDQFSGNVTEYFQYMLKKFNGVEFCLHAHDHGLSAVDIFDDGIIYYGCSSMKDKCYLLFDITPESYKYEVVYY